jgi:uncharacterized protein involved in exopolysaccharide biosynthesis
MNFSELESLMSSRGVTSLADIARTLNTTPQAVSNWKSRNQVPHHIVVNLNKISQSLADSPQASAQPPNPQFTTPHSPFTMEEDTISLSDILLTLAEQLKVIVLTTFISVFFTFTYVQFIQQSQYVSWATVLLPENKMGNLGGLSGLASQFGVTLPSDLEADLSSPSLYPELIRSRTFTERILKKVFYSEKFGKELTLLSILSPPGLEQEARIISAASSLRSMISFNKSMTSKFSRIEARASEALLAKELVESVLFELENLSRSFKTKSTNDKIKFIKNRITSVMKDLKFSEHRLKAFNEQNRQISSPALQLEQDRLDRDVEVQKNIYLTLKQQLELSKIEEVQKISIVQILDKPQVPLGYSNKNLKYSVLLAGVLGLGFGVLLGFIRAYANNSDKDERKKLRRVKNFIKKKGKDFLMDSRVSGIVSLLLLVGLPFYLGHESENPVFFGMYSAKLMLINTIYILMVFSFLILFFYLRHRKNSKPTR